MRTIDELFENIPDAIKPEYITPHINDEIILYDGLIKLSQGDIQAEGQGFIKVEWHPKHRISFNLQIGNESALFSILDSVNLEISDFPKVEGHVNNINCGSQGYFIQGYIDKLLSSEVAGSLNHIICHVVNFPNCIGTQRAVLREEDKLSTVQRHSLEADVWKLTLDGLPTTAENIKTLKTEGGFAITHVAKLERIDGCCFSSTDAESFIDQCSHYLSFARGYRIGIVLFAGYDVNAEKNWMSWQASTCQPWDGTSSWLPLHTGEALENAFPGFIDLFNKWGDVLPIVINSYLESNANGRFLEHSIVLSQIALEMLSWTHLVKMKRTLSESGYERLWASDKFRLLLDSLGIPLLIPTERLPFRETDEQRCNITLLPDLVALASSMQWADGPHALTDLRNAIVHPKKIQKVTDASFDALFQGRYLGLWYVELVILALSQYEGCYSNRLFLGKHEGEYDKVPWAD